MDVGMRKILIAAQLKIGQSTPPIIYDPLYAWCLSQIATRPAIKAMA
jgi:hypothetical protein